MVLLDGKKISEEILGDLGKRIVLLPQALRLAIVFVGNDAATENFIVQKKKVGERTGVDVVVHRFKEGITKEELVDKVRFLAEKYDGIIVQLPIPGIDNEQDVLDAIPISKDVDVLSVEAVGNFRHMRGGVWPPIAATVKTLLDYYHIDYTDKHIVLVGGGKLIGSALNTWFKRKDVDVGHTIITKHTLYPERFIREGDIVIAGVPGRPKFITADMIREGAIVIDAGIVKVDGKIAGNVDFDSVSKKASYITPVPGGIGPVMVAMVYQNLYTLSQGSTQ